MKTQVEVCPICKCPRKRCGFFRRLCLLKFDNDLKKSAAIRCRMFLLYHHDHCERCGLSKDACHRNRVKRVVARLMKQFGYADEGQIRSDLEQTDCRAFSLEFNQEPVLPEWWKEKKNAKVSV